MTFDVHQLDLFVLVGAVVTLAAILAVRVSARAGLPSLLIYLLIGVFLGEAGPFAIPFEDAQLAHALGFGALAIILAEGGLTTDWRQMRPSIRLGVSLATVGVAVSVAVVAVGSHYLLGLPWELAILLGAICSPTDAAAVFSVLRVVPLPKRLTGVLEAESGLNDAPTVVLVGVISTGAVGSAGLFGVAGIIVFELAAGAAIGLACGFLGSWVMRRAALPSSGLYPDRRPVPGLHRLRRRLRSSTRPASLRSTSPPSSSATASCPTASPPGRSPRAWRGWPRSGSS